jgi:hypothetical protein
VISEADKLWVEDERLEFFQWLANHPDAGDVVVICSRQYVRRLTMASRNPKGSAGEELGLKLLRSVREMKAGLAARVTKVEINEVAPAYCPPVVADVG